MELVGIGSCMKVIIVVVCWWRIKSCWWSGQFRVAWATWSQLGLFRSLIQNFHIRAEWLKVGLLRPLSLGNHQMLWWKIIRRTSSSVIIGSVCRSNVDLLFLIIRTTPNLLLHTLTISFGINRLSLLVRFSLLSGTCSLILHCHICRNIRRNASKYISIREVMFTCRMWSLLIRSLLGWVQRWLSLWDWMMLVCTSDRTRIKIVH